MRAAFVFGVMFLVAAASLADALWCGHCATSYTTPVCGVNGVTYKNYCYLTCMNVPMASVGYCPQGRNYFGINPYRQTPMLG